MSQAFKLGEYEVDPLRRQIRLNGDLVPLAQKPFDVLLYLVDRVGQVVSKEELMAVIWQQSFVEEANLTQSIFLLRRALQDKASESRFIITVPGRGYQLGVPPVPLGDVAKRAEAPDADGAHAAKLAPAPFVRVPTDREVGAQPIGYRNRRMAVLAAGAVVSTLALVAGWAAWRHHAALKPAFTLRRLTNSGDVQQTAISASGSYVAYVSRSALGSESISISDLRSHTSRVILQDDVDRIQALTFSQDDLYLYYRSYSKADPDQVSSEHRIPLLGGEPLLVIQDIDGPVTFVADGKRVCFLRDAGEDHFAFLSADAESGKNERILASGGRPLPNSAACAPDGEKAAVSTEVGGLSIIDFKTGKSQPFYQSAQGNEIYADLTWKADGSEIIGTAVTPFNLYPSLFSVSYPGADRDRITQDIDSYQSPGITADGEMIVAREGALNAQFQSFNLPLLGSNPEVSSFPWTAFLGWSGEDRIVGSAAEGGIKTKGVETGQESLIQTLNGMHFLQPDGCGAGSLVASGSDNSHKEISVWHMAADGSRLEQLTHGAEDILPVCSPDGKWVLYADNSFRQKAMIYRVSAQGGAPAKVGEGSVWFAVSHKGDKIAWIEAQGKQHVLIQAELEIGRRIRSTPIPARLNVSRSITFSPDDQHVFVISHGNTSDSIFDIPLDGSAPLKLIEFRGARVAALAVSPAGKHLGVVTVKPVSDAVLLQRSRQ
jgi:DNA-binding winged helix-turn-helix (wHTH) protein/Tol biopolymer transport system component